MSDIFIYIKMSVKTFLKYPSFKSLYSGLKYYPAWKKYLAGQNKALEKTLWITFGATDFLKKIATSNMRVFEYGSGGSTLFWSARVNHVISVEHDEAWFSKMKKEFTDLQIRNTEYFFAAPTPDPDFVKKNYQNPADYISGDKNYSGKNFEEYVKKIDKYADESFDVIVVDGRARPSCIQHSLSKLKSGGYLVIDNSEREYYMAPFKFHEQSWKMWKFAGPVPYIHDFSETTILRKIQ
jgi:hypothetical protein